MCKSKLETILALIKTANFPEKLKSGNQKLLEITANQVLVLGEINLEERLESQDDCSEPNYSKEKELETFVEAISSNIKRLNHYGVRFYTNDVDNEIKELKKVLSRKDIKLYEEESVFENDRWFFIGNTENWEEPQFEMVMVYGEKDPWTPHFQIDIDTNLTFEILEKHIQQHFGFDAILWKMKIKNVGVVLTLVKIARIEGLKIYLFVGTNLRDTKYFRKQLLQEII